MTLIGKDNLQESLTALLDSHKLARLCSDLLACRGHREIQITDGPGDGGRDINSVMRDSQRYLTQCKFHGDPKVTCSSHELSELPMAMTKLDYKHGLFITNGRISPQAKREFLDNYPNLTMKFLDGEGLAKEVMSNTLLRALWFDGENFADINCAAVFPILIRVHEDDIPYSLFESWGEHECEIKSGELEQKYPNTRFIVRPARTTTEPFEPYRAPEPLAQSEGGMPFLQVVEIVAQGFTELASLPTISNDVCKGLLENLDEGIGGATVRIGRPYISPLQGDLLGVHIPTVEAPLSYIRTEQDCVEELAWFSSVSNEKWTNECDARVTEMESVRLYSAELDCCIAYEIEGRKSAIDRQIASAIREVQLKGWEKSLFCLMPAWETWEHSAIPAPDEKAPWPWDGRLICGWHHPCLLGGIVPFRTSKNQDSFFKPPDEKRWEAYIKTIRKHLVEINGVDVLEPAKARHMLAVAWGDPFPDNGYSVINTAKVTAYPDTIPSPIAPGSRRFRFSVAWKTELGAEYVEASASSALVVNDAVQHKLRLCQRFDEFVCLEVDLFPAGLMNESTDRLLDTIYDYLKEFLDSLESTFRRDVATQRLTADFWKKRYNVRLGTSIVNSGKAIRWAKDEEGKMVSFDATGNRVPLDLDDLYNSMPH